MLINNERKTNVSKKNFRKSPIEIRTIDELAILTDEELSTRMSFIYEDMDRRGIDRFSYESKPWEIELAYVVREFEIRSTRKTAHRFYLDRLRTEDIESAIKEKHLPEYQGNSTPDWS